MCLSIYLLWSVGAFVSWSCAASRVRHRKAFFLFVFDSFVGDGASRQMAPTYKRQTYPLTSKQIFWDEFLGGDVPDSFYSSTCRFHDFRHGWKRHTYISSHADNGIISAGALLSSVSASGDGARVTKHNDERADVFLQGARGETSGFSRLSIIYIRCDGRSW